ncbi:MAG: TIGR02452 family protein [Eubacteriales bacterium]|nr:TIGR02452 family protein [Eubacteriales bacterium]
MTSRTGLIESFKDTQRMIRRDETLRSLTVKAQAGTILYLGGYEAMDPAVKTESPVFEVTGDTTFHCAQSYAGGSDKVAVLNFANAYSPGGGVVNGAMAQEECLCRSSNLYAALTIPYLLKNYYKWNSKHTGDMGSDSVIYSPGVTVFKTDDPIPAEMSRWFSVDVLTCAAPYYDLNKKRPVSLEKLEEVFFARIRNILEVAAANDVDILILGAFGCGAFNNPPELVAGVFRRLLVEKRYGRFFKKTVFAIKRNNAQNTNLLAFQDAFRD